MPWTNPLQSSPTTLADGSSVGVDNAPGTVLAASEQQFLATPAGGISVPATGVLTTVVDLALAGYPAGTGLGNFATAIVSLDSTARVDAIVEVSDTNGDVTWAQPIDTTESLAGVIIPLPTGGSTSGAQHPVIQVVNFGAEAIGATVTLLQAPLLPATSATPPATDVRGVAYVVPTVPDVNNSDHPPSEVLSANSFSAVANANWIPAPGAGRRIRLFALSLAVQSGSAGGAMSISFTDTGGNTSGVRVAVGFALSDTMGGQIPGQGIACATNTPVAIAVAGAISCAARAVWIIETV